ncbi:MAG: bifunctional oligoribonuclease/PAP phosphatase NrnA [Treponema sp.]|jgi:phosphoesterase RecJ-like protein|nr:bifunctional oligoribonuclease/PAP phosphatase NrnA [Treponema sp.]
MDSDTETQEVPPELVQFIVTGSRFIIAGHKEPDGDCVGSQLALRSVLARLGKEAVVCSEGPFKRAELKNYAGQFSGDISKIDKNGAKVIVVDCTGMDRTGNLQKALEEFPCAVIDHHAAVKHPPSTLSAPVYVDANAPSCTVLIEKLIAALGLEVTREEAELLLFGLCTDTGFFRHLTEKNSSAFRTAANMVSRGASPKNIYASLNRGKTLNSRVLLGHILSRAESHFDGRLLLSYETLEDFQTFGLEGRDSDALSHLLQSIEGVEAYLIIRQECAENCTVSLRSVDSIDVSQIAASFGGGGHKNAAGLTMKGNISSVKEIMINSFFEIFIDS